MAAPRGGGFTGRANSALPVGDPGLPLAEAVTAVEDWYRRRDLRPMIVLPQGAAPDPLENLLAERSWVPRPGPAFVMTADIADVPASTIGVRFAAEPDAAFLGLYRYRGQDLPPIAQTLMMSAPWQAFGTISHQSRAVACGRVSVAGDLGLLTAVEVDAAAGVRVWARPSPRGWPPRPPAAARAGSCSRSRRTTPRPARSTSGAVSATPIATTT